MMRGFKPVYFAKAITILGWAGHYDVWYFAQPEDAFDFAEGLGRGARVLQTSDSPALYRVSALAA